MAVAFPDVDTAVDVAGTRTKVSKALPSSAGSAVPTDSGEPEVDRQCNESALPTAGRSGTFGSVRAGHDVRYLGQIEHFHVEQVGHPLLGV